MSGETSGPRGILTKIAGYLGSAAVGFLIPLVGTSYMLEPARNLSLIPNYIDNIDVCKVDMTAVRNAVAHRTSDPDDASYVSFLESIKHSKSPWIAHSQARDFEKRLSDDNILNCHLVDATGRQDYVNTTMIKVPATFYVEHATSYLIDRQCTLSVDDFDLKLPMRVDTEDPQTVFDPASTDDDQRDDTTPLAIKEPGIVYLRYDSRFGEAVDRIAFRKLLDAVQKSETYRVRIACATLGFNNKRTGFGEKAEYTFQGHRPMSNLPQRVAKR